MSSVIDDIVSPTKDGPPILDFPLIFKCKLAIGDEAYKYLSKADNFLDCLISIVAGLGGGSIAGVAWLATLSPFAQFALLFGLTSTPVGWIAGAGALSTVLAFVLMKQGKILKKKTTIEIPKHLNTPLDLLAQAVISLIMPPILKMAIADGCLCEKEREAIMNYFVKEWGFNREFVANAIHEQESLIAGFDYKEYRQLLFATTCNDNEIKYDVIKKELSSLLTEIMNADEEVSPEEEKELEMLNKIINEPAEGEVRSSSKNILDSIERRKEAIREIIKLKSDSDNKPVQKSKSETEQCEDLLFEKLRQLDNDSLNSLLLSGLRVSQNKLNGLDREELIQMCSKELRSAAGSTTRNLFRSDHEFPYKQILIDVADRLADGFTPLSWTKYKLGDSHTEQEIEDSIIKTFEERARKWWEKLPEKKKKEFIGGLQSVLDGEKIEKVNFTGGAKTFLTQQLIDSVIQNGVTLGLTQLSAPGLTGLLGVSILSHIGWLILVQSLGFMTGIKIALFGIGGMGALGGAVSFLGATAVGGALSIPSTLLAMDGTAYRKTIPTIIMLLTINRAKSN
jgi:uncharacterized protein YaaW (UPF0174 family)